MELLNKNIETEIKRHSLEESPNECCGIILEKDAQMIPLRCENISDNKKMNFEINPIDYLKASKRGEVKAYYHSHVNDKRGRFSDVDIKVSKAHRLPLVMYSIFHDKFFLTNP